MIVLTSDNNLFISIKKFSKDTKKKRKSRKFTSSNNQTVLVFRSFAQYL